MVCGSEAIDFFEKAKAPALLLFIRNIIGALNV